MKKTRCPNFGESQFGWGCTHPDHARREELKLCAGMTDNCYKKRETNWDILSDRYGYTVAIMFRDEPIVYLSPGALVNSLHLEDFIKMLNRKGCTINIKENHGTIK